MTEQQKQIIDNSIKAKLKLRVIAQTDYYNDGTQRDFKIYDFYFIQFWKPLGKRYKPQ